MSSRSDYAGKHAYRGRVAADYDRDRVGEALWDTEQAFVADWCTRQVRGTSVLDLPTGTGRFLDLFLTAGLQVHAMDISDDMLAEVRRRWPAGGLPPGLTLAVGDAERIPLAEGGVDFVLSWRLVHLLPLPVVRVALREFARVARRQVVLQVFAVRPRGQRPPFAEGFRRAVRPLLRRLRAVFGGPPVPTWNHITSYSHGEEDLEAAWSAAGLHCVKVHGFGAGADGLLNQVYFLEAKLPEVIPSRR